VNLSFFLQIVFLSRRAEGVVECYVGYGCHDDAEEVFFLCYAEDGKDDA